MKGKYSAVLNNISNINITFIITKCIDNSVHRVYNQWSQQNVKPTMLIKSEKDSSDIPPALEERLSTTEKILGINKPVPRDVYERIKKIEDRLLFLESISPEYKDLWVTCNLAYLFCTENIVL